MKIKYVLIFATLGLLGLIAIGYGVYKQAQINRAVKYLATEFVIPESTIRAIYGDNATGRKKMLADYQRLQKH